MDISRRNFIKQTVLASSTLVILSSCRQKAKVKISGNLVKDKDKLLDLSEGLTYKVIASSGDKMSDGLAYGRRPDGMAAFDIGESLALVINHEVGNANYKGAEDGSLNSSLAYRTRKGKAISGGTSTLVLDKRNLSIKKSFRSLTGTISNCAGGVTPWGTWVSCEESYDDEHGYAFEVNPKDKHYKGFKRLSYMGRFKREAVVVDSKTNIVYQTEDSTDGLFYRFIPKKSRMLDGEGKLQALKVIGGIDSSNAKGKIKEREKFATTWVDIADATASKVKTKEQGLILGATPFVRGEGIIMGQDEIYFVSTTGGQKRLGQIWRYFPREEKIELFYESRDKDEFYYGDNITIAPWGDLIVCEDNKSGRCRLLGITKKGEVYVLAQVAGNRASELTGACFSADGKIMFVNIQDEGKTLAIMGNW